MKLRWRRRHEHLDERVKDARAEAELSRERLRETREQVVMPLRREAEHNEFAELIRASLIEGRGNS